MKRYTQMVLSLSLVAVVFTACSQPGAGNPSSQETTTVLPGTSSIAAGGPGTSGGKTVEPYADVRSMFGTVTVLEEHEYAAEDMYTFWFNEGTVFEGNDGLQATLLENGRNPGLGVRRLHEEGITGAGVTVAIIDQPLFMNHPEYDGKIVAYHTVADAGKGSNPSSMHGPGVTSLLAGNTIGTAPGVSIYYVAFASWDGDAAQGAQALNWLVEQNEMLDEEHKIRVVSASVDFSDTALFINHDQWAEAVERAQAAGMMVLDARTGYDTCIIWPSHYSREAPDDITQSSMGAPGGRFAAQPVDTLAAPVGFRTTAEHYVEAEPSYAYDAEGGHSWAIPYGAGIFALGWQLDPGLTVDEIKAIAFDTAYVNDKGEVYLYPSAFIDAVKKGG